MNHQALGVADVGQVREQLDRVDELLAGFQAALDAEADDAAEAFLEVFRGDFVARIVGQAGIGHPGHQRMALEELRDRERVVPNAAAGAAAAFPAPAGTGRR